MNMSKVADLTPTRMPPGQYFEERKKGQMNQLKTLLNKAINDQDSKKGRQVVKKIIAYMTLGMDASPVFSQMCRASFTNDQITKKMIYFYLTTYAEDNPDLAIMAVNTFQKDCKHNSSKVRGLALRNLCSFRSVDYVNNVLPTIRELLTDFEPYVKKTAITGLLKIFYHDPVIVFSTYMFIKDDENIISTLSHLIRDSDSLVSVNAVMALNEILVSEGGIPLTPKLVKYLYNRLKEYNGWEQTQILQILYKYDPKDQKQHYEIMSLLWDKLKLSSTSLVLSSIRIIIKLARQKKQLFANVVQKIKAPLLTLMSSNENSGTFQTMYIILQHIEYVICHMDGKKFYEKDFKYFYCKINEPTYIKQLKVKILGELASQMNLGDMLNELNEYAIDNDVPLARKSVEVISQIAISLPDVAKALLTSLMSFYKSARPHLVNQSMIGFGKVLKKYPKLFSDLSSVLLIIDRNIVDQPNAVKSFIWILGTFSNQIDPSPYILEEFLDEGNFQKYSDSVKSVYLTQVIQTFLKRPPETYKLLARTFSAILNGQNTSMLLRDHATYYYRALKDNVDEVKRGFGIIEVQYSKNVKQKDRLAALLSSNSKNTNESSFQQDVFGNLSLVYRKKQAKFIKQHDYFITMRNKQLGLIEPDLGEDEQEEQDNNNGEQQGNDLNGIDLGGDNGTDSLTNATSIQANDLLDNIAVTAEQFEETWNQLEHYEQVEYNSDNEEYLDEQSVEQLFKMWHLYCMASASEDDEQLLKFFIYARHRGGKLMCLQLNIDKNAKKISLLTKAPTENAAHLLNQYICEFMRVNEFITDS